MINIKTDSRKVKQGDTFVAIIGNTVDGHDYIDMAIKNGATKIIAMHGSYEVETEIVQDTSKYLQDYLVNNYSNKFSNLKIIGVTGTNGKTTTCYLTYQLLNLLGKKACYIGTIGFYMDKIKRELPNTTPDILELYNLLFEAIDNNIEYVVMEVSSHALSLGRILGLHFDIGAFTNLTQDHLDYHKTMEEYKKAKLKILDYIKDDGKMIVNIDDNYGKYFVNDKALTLGQEKSDYQITKFNLTNKNTNIEFTYQNKLYNITTNLIGKFNVYNYMTSLAIVNNLNINIDDIIAKTLDLYAPVGRCQIINKDTSIIVIDYAHTPDAVLKIIDSFKEVTKGRIITIIGCGGDRDPKKRPIMGNIATDNSDYVIFTNDNPRCEDEKKIMFDIVSGVTTDNYEIEHNRKIAIKKGIDLLRDNDTLLILGKGHEDYQIIGREKIHLSDIEEVKKNLSK